MIGDRGNKGVEPHSAIDDRLCGEEEPQNISFPRLLLLLLLVFVVFLLSALDISVGTGEVVAL